MIHVLTVHWEDDRWVDVQLRYLKAHVREPYRVYAFLNGQPEAHKEKYFYSSVEPIREHPEKLNLLGDVVTSSDASDDDWIVFIDGDAFPIGDVVSFARKKLEKVPLVAIQRKENDGDIQPHPSFCLTTVGLWRSLGSDWSDTIGWQNDRGETVHDVGGNLLAALRDAGIAWHPMLRSNRLDLHPVFFGVYDDLIYHHGAGFRSAWTRADAGKLKPAGGRVGGLLRRLKGSRAQAANQKLSDDVFRSIVEDPQFYRRFTGS